ncbi:hypothetical protein IQ283_04195 [Alkalihalobacillus hwajinpoensis]|uniref:hypothetical protein n=1 Tax=Guptibacillus hwajinpoensis TaxID=208199 RepID=UPI0018847AD9|nr:hypothetical protein [Pseudalkalibacillus hwajinpoensis]MBF0705797.1 hypothetical protein [Pseudalkalibacillus hwajinpoensis]
MSLRVSALTISFLIVSLITSPDTYAFSEDNHLCNIDQLIVKDITRSYPELMPLLKSNNSIRYSIDDLQKALVIEGTETSHLKSLFPLFNGASQGEKMLFILGGEESLPPKYDNSFVGYLIYKAIDGSNVKITLRRGTASWDIVSKDKEKGKRVYLSEKCRNN